MNFLAINSEELINQLFPNLWIFIAHIIATIVLLIVLSRLVYKPFKKAMRERRMKIRESLDDAALKQAQANSNNKQAKELINNVKMEADKILSKGRAESEVMKREIIEQAHFQVNELNKRNKVEMEKEKEKYEDDIRKTIVSIAFSAASQILKEEIDQEKHDKLIENFIDNLDLD